MNNYQTEQEKFWAGEFGNTYVQRNQGNDYLSASIALYSEVLKHTNGINSVIEFGANVGLNIKSLKLLLPKVSFSAIEINNEAVKHLQAIDGLNIYHGSILDITPKDKSDFVFTKGVLIHINPDMLPLVYEKLYTTSSRYICISEYYNPSPMEIPYRGHSQKMYKRDFAGEIMDLHPNLQLIGYGFCYQRDPNFGHDDATWFLMEKKALDEIN